MTDRLSLFILYTLVLVSAGFMLYDNGWFGLTQGMTTSPEFLTHPGRWGLVITSTLQLTLPIGLFLWGWQPQRITALSLLTTPILLAYFLYIRTPQGREPITEWDQVVLILLALTLAFSLILNSLKKPGKTKVPYMLTGIWSVGLLVIQLVFHFTLIFPGTTLETNRAQHDIQTIQSAKTSENLQVLITTQAVPLLPLDTTNLKTLGVARDDSVTTALDNILQDAPQTLHIWTVDGVKDVDQIYVVYDGYTQNAWIAPASAYMEGRLMGMKGYMGGMALFVLVWTGGLLWLNQIHTKRRKEKGPGKKPEP